MGTYETFTLYKNNIKFSEDTTYSTFPYTWTFLSNILFFSNHTAGKSEYSLNQVCVNVVPGFYFHANSSFSEQITILKSLAQSSHFKTTL